MLMAKKRVEKFILSEPKESLNEITITFFEK